MMLRLTAVCTVSLSSLSFLAPKYLATSTLAPMESPMNRFDKSSIRELVEPTAARELSPANRPTTIMSAALNRSCNTPEHISGKANSNIFLSMGPLHISISCFSFSSLFSSKFSSSRSSRSIIFSS